MPGVDLALDLPTLADSMSTIVSKLVTAVSAIETDLEAKVVPAEININAALSMNGASLTNTGSVLFVSGNDPTAAGSVYYSGGEFYAIDSTGTIQLTANGSLNFASAGAIVGDYGGVNPAQVSYNDVAGEYRFTEDTDVWADLVADDLILKSAAGSVRFGVMDAISTDRSFLIKALPAAGTGLLVYDSADSSVTADGSTAIDAISIASLTLTNPPKHSDFTQTVSCLGGHVVASGGATYDLDYHSPGNTVINGNTLTKNSAGGTITWHYQVTCPNGSYLKSVKCTFTGAAGQLAIRGAAYATTTHKTGSIAGAALGEVTVTNVLTNLLDVPLSPTAANIGDITWVITVTLTNEDAAFSNVLLTFNRT